MSPNLYPSVHFWFLCRGRDCRLSDLWNHRLHVMNWNAERQSFACSFMCSRFISCDEQLPDVALTRSTMRATITFHHPFTEYASHVPGTEMCLSFLVHCCRERVYAFIIYFLRTMHLLRAINKTECAISRNDVHRAHRVLHYIITTVNDLSFVQPPQFNDSAAVSRS